MKSYIVGICGSSGSGKTSVCNWITSNVSHPEYTTFISSDYFYRKLTPEERADMANYNFDHPDSIDMDKLAHVLDKLIHNESVEIYPWSMYTNDIDDKLMKFVPNKVIIVEGLFIFSNDAVMRMLDLKVFLSVDAEVTLTRRMLRDNFHYNWSFESTLERYFRFVRGGYLDFIKPMKRYADILIPSGVSNKTGLQVLVNHVDRMINNAINSEHHVDHNRIMDIEERKKNSPIKEDKCLFPLLNKDFDK